MPPLPGTYQYFKETDFHSKSHRLGAVSHCDTRFGLDRALDEDEVRETLKALLGSYAATMRQLGVETWIAHGTLLGWYWNQKLLPWDTDIDAQIPYQDLVRLATNYNMTVFRHHSLDTDSVRSFLLDVNPHHSIVSPEDVANKIDGRWIDRTNGKFIDITALHQDERVTVKKDVTSLFCKDGHRYNVSGLLSCGGDKVMADQLTRTKTFILSRCRRSRELRLKSPRGVTESCSKSTVPKHSLTPDFTGTNWLDSSMAS